MHGECSRVFGSSVEHRRQPWSNLPNNSSNWSAADRDQLHQPGSLIPSLRELSAMYLETYETWFRGRYADQRLTAEPHPFDAFERASHSVARGNLKVFEEIASSSPATSKSTGRMRRASPVLSVPRPPAPGDPPDGSVTLRQAFTHYLPPAARARPENTRATHGPSEPEIGLPYEQTRLQPEIRRSVARRRVHDTQQDLGRRALEALSAGRVAVAAVRAASASRRGSRSLRQAQFSEPRAGSRARSFHTTRS